LMSHYPLLVRQLNSKNKNWMVKYTQIRYQMPAFAREPVIIRTCIVDAGNTSVKLEFIMLDHKKEKIKAMMWTDLRFIDLNTGRPTSHGQELIHFLQAVKLKEVEVNDFALRFSQCVEELNSGLNV